ncbi:hypothetical protein ACQ4PT_047083 [Festuca glaucescens]
MAADGGRSSATACTEAARAEEADGSTVFRPRTAPNSPVRTMVALTLWLGVILCNLLLVLASVFFFHERTVAFYVLSFIICLLVVLTPLVATCTLLLLKCACRVLGTQLFLMFAPPVNYTDRLGRSIARSHRLAPKKFLHSHVARSLRRLPIHFVCRFICKYAVDYFPITLHVEDYGAFNPNTAYVFASAVFHVPFQRQIWTWLGQVPASRKNFCYYLTAGYSCVVVPGGLREMLHMDHHHDYEVAFIKSRKGFFRMAVQTGCPLVPVFCFGQGYLYNWWRPGSISIIKIARAIKAPPIVFGGKFGTHIPFKSPMDVFVGRPIEVKKNEQPTMDEINQVHEQFVIYLQELFNKHKNKARCPNLQLRVK